jgi:hypothetical protein
METKHLFATLMLLLLIYGNNSKQFLETNNLAANESNLTKGYRFNATSIQSFTFIQDFSNITNETVINNAT